MAVKFPQHDRGNIRGGSELFDADSVFDSDYFAESLSSGRLKVWNGTSWVEKPAKVWNGTSWVEKPAKVWNGSSWV
jgi:hypothetical protein